MAARRESRGSSRSRRSILAPSLSARAGSGCVSMNRPSAPVATAAREPVNIKKGQFMAPEAMRFAAEKVRSAGNNDVMVTERGTTFGYGDLVVDFRGVTAWVMGLWIPFWASAAPVAPIASIMPRIAFLIGFIACLIQ